MGKPLHVLIVEDSEEDTLLILRELKRGGFDPIHERVETAESMKAALSTKTWDLILADYSMPHFNGLEALKLSKESGLDLPFIIVSGSIGEDVAVEAMKSGAHDYLMKNNLTRLIPAIEQELREAEVRRKLKHSERALQEAEKRYRQVVENAAEIIYAIDEKGNFIYANPAGLKVTGYSLQELQSFNYADLVLPDHRERVSQIYVNQFQERLPATYVEFPFLSKTGEIIWFGQNTTLVMEGDKIVGFHIIARDITERKRAEEVLRSSEERYRTILENIEDGYYELDLAGNFTFFNDSLCRIWGYPKEELMGMNDRQYTDQENAKKLFQTFNKIYRTGEYTKEFDWEIIRKDGTKRSIEASVSLIKDPSDNRVGFRGIVRDITERKQAEKTRVEAQQQELQMKDNFISNVSHELRTPLTTIKEFTSIISDEIPGKLNKDQKEYIDIIKGNVDRLARLINDILDISKIKSGRIELVRAFVDINKLVEGIISTLRPEADKKHVALKNLSHTPLADVYIDPDKMVQVFTNLIENAIKFTPENGEITVEIEDKKKHIECSIADTGRGISPGNLKKLFTRFQQFDRVSGPGAKGTGLGLAITKELIKLHNGTIWVKSKLDKGTKFIFTLPHKTELIYLKEILTSKIERIASSGETLALLFIDIVNFDELKETLDKDSLVGLFATIKNITSSTFRKAEDVIFPLEQKRIAVIFTVKHMNDTKAVMDRLKSALQVRLFLKKDFEAEAILCMSAAIYGEQIDSVEKMIGGTSKIYDNIPISLIEKREVVIVDDEEVILKSAKSHLEKTGDFRVYAYSNPVEALEQIIRIRPEIFIMDIKMPQMSGYELVGRLYSHKGFEEIPVIFITAYDFDDDQLEILASKRVGRLKKPFSLTELLDKINSFSISDFKGLNAENGKVKS